MLLCRLVRIGIFAETSAAAIVIRAIAIKPSLMSVRARQKILLAAAIECEGSVSAQAAAVLSEERQA
jgi:hypothetical protein